MKSEEVVMIESERLNNPVGLDKKQSRLLTKCMNLFAVNDFHKFQKLIKNSIFCNKDTFPSDMQQVLEYIVKSASEGYKYSATYISLIWEEYKLWEELKLCEKGSVNINIKTFELVQESTDIRALFSLLMFDWHNPDQCGEDVTYFLVSKFDLYEQITKESLFVRLYSIIDESDKPNYRHVCLRIIYQYLDELNKTKQIDEVFEKLEDRMKIDNVLTMDCKDFQKKILKVFVTYWNVSGDGLLSGKNINLIGDLKAISSFFDLAFMLKAKVTSTFENQFHIYIEKCKRIHGFYYEAKLKADNRLLLHIAEKNKLTQIRSFIFRICPFNEVNATPLTNAQEISKILNLNIYPWTSDEETIIVSYLTISLVFRERSL